MSPQERAQLEASLVDQPPEVLAATKARLGWMFGIPDHPDPRKREGARSKQMPPAGDWGTWLILAGRGFGKTKTGAEECWWRAFSNPGYRIAVVAPTKGDLIRTIFQGESGFRSLVPPLVLHGGDWDRAFNKSEFKLTFANGSEIQGFSAENPERLRGPNHHFAWVDELGAFALATMQDTWDMLQLTMRLGVNPQVMITTTPKPYPLIVEIMNSKDTYLVTGSTFENKANLSDKFLKRMVEQFEGTTIGRQELYAEVIDLSEHGVFKRDHFRLWPANKPLPIFKFVLQSYDTAYTEKTAASAKKEEADPSAFSCWGVFYNEETERNEIMLIDAWEKYLSFHELRQEARQNFEMLYGADPEDEYAAMGASRRVPLILNEWDKAQGHGKDVDAIVVEAVGGGIYFCQELNRMGLPVFEYKPRAVASQTTTGRADKLSRAHLVSHLPVNGHVWVPESSIKPGKPTDWAEKLLTQLCAFPFVKHDDMTDTTTQAWKFILDGGMLVMGDELWATEDEDEDFIDDDEIRRRSYSNPYD